VELDPTLDNLAINHALSGLFHPPRRQRTVVGDAFSFGDHCGVARIEFCLWGDGLSVAFLSDTSSQTIRSKPSATTT
jgi:hypothetical protein